MSTQRRPHRMAFLGALLCGLAMATGAVAQQQRFWTGGSGHWNDAAHWAATAGGPGGAGVPRSGDAVTIAPAGGQATVQVNGNAAMGDLLVDASRGAVVLEGNGGALRIGGDFSLRGSVAWNYAGPVELFPGKAVCQLDLRGIPLRSALRCTGGGTWSMRSDLVLADGATLELRKGTLATNGNMLQAAALDMAPRGAKLMAGSSVVRLGRPFNAPAPDAVEPGTSRLLVGGAIAAWGTGRSTDAAARGVNVCATAVGQTPFTIDAQLMSNFNGFGVSCHGVCNGSVRVVITGGVGPFTQSWVGGPSTATWNNVCPGNQIVIVTDQGQGVSCATTVQVTDPASLSVIFTGVVPPTCAGVCNGRSNAFAVGGVPGYTYSWNNGAGTGASFNQLCPGTNHLRVTDANGCAFDTTFSYPVQSVQPHFTKTNVNCNSACDGTATVAPTGGTNPYTYTWGPGNPAGNGTPHVTGLCAGNYTVNVRDANGCDTTVQFQITEPPPIVPNATHVNATCGNRCNGTATVNPTGATGPFTYTWAPAPGAGQGTPNATGLCKGTYTVTIHDQASGCNKVVTFVIDAPPVLVPHPSSTPPTCAGSCNGTTIVAPTGGTAPYTFLWTPAPPAGQGTASATGLCAGTWSVRVTDQAGCDTTVQFNLQAPPPITATTTQTNVTCAGACNGTAGAPATGGTGTLTYLWSPAPPAGQGTANATGLCAGTWNVTITDANGCSITRSFTLTAPPPVTIAGTQTNPSCGNTCNGTATGTPSGGTPGYTYAWAPQPPTGQGTPTASGLCPGTWTLTVTDSKGCTATRTYTIQAAAPLQVFLAPSPVSCPGTCDGSAQAVVAGGTPLYTYLWTPAPGSGQGTSGVSGLCAGPHTLHVTDAHGCDTTVAFTIDAPPPLTANATVQNPACAGNCNGSIVLAPTGGTGSYTYQWTPVPPNGQGHAQATGLCAGSYSVQVSSGGCDTTFHFTLAPPLPFTVSLASTPTNCTGGCIGTATLSGSLAGLTMLWAPAPGAGQGTANATGLCAGNYSVTVSNAAGCDTVIAFTITAPPPITANLTVTPESCTATCTGTATVAPTGGSGAFTFIWTPAPGGGQGTSTATGLCAGVNYTVDIADAAGCVASTPFTVPPHAPMLLAVAATPVSCADACDGTATVTVTGGAVPPYIYQWTPQPPNGQGTSHVTGLCHGYYQVTVTDAFGCDTMQVLVISAPPPINAHATVTNVACGGQCTGAVDLAPTGGTAPFAYTWSPQPPAGQGTAHIGQLCAGDWTVTITDAHGCTATSTYQVTEPAPLVSLAEVTKSHCGLCDGIALLHTSGGNAPYLFQWGPPVNISTTDSLVGGLCAGLHPVTVTDAGGCALQIVVPVADEDGEHITTVDGITSCPAMCDGTAAVSYNCDNPPCTVHWTNMAGTVLATGTDQLTGLCAGSYLAVLTNGNGCLSTDTVRVTEPAPLIGNLSSTPVSCPGLCDGTATIGISGGTGPFTFTWSPAPGGGQGTPHATGLCAGSYQVLVHDQGGCDASFSVLITAPAPLVVDAVTGDVSCHGLCDGSIVLNVQGGSGTPQYQWSPAPPTGQGTSTIGGLCAGSWSVAISDANGCSTIRNFTLSDPPAITLAATATQSHCAVCDGTVAATVSGGSGAMAITWANAGGTVGSGTALTGLCAGVYTASATDAHGCSTTQTVAVPDANGEHITAVDGHTLCGNSCDGTASVNYTCTQPPCTVAWFNAGGTPVGNQPSMSGLCSGTYLVQVLNGSGCLSIDTAQVLPSHQILPNLGTTPVSCRNSCDGTATVGPAGGVAPYTYTWVPAPPGGQGTPHATGLCPGTYQVVIADNSGCDTTVSVLITAPLAIDPHAQLHQMACAGTCDGSIILAPTGGAGPYTYSWSPIPPNGQGSSTAQNLCAGSWTVTVADSHGCDTTITWAITAPVPLAAIPSATQSTCGACNGTATVAPAGGTAPYIITWKRNGAIIGTSNTINGLCAGLYTVLVEDAHGCSITVPVMVSDAGGEVLATTDFMLTCPDHCDGVVGVNFTCSAPTCSIAWFNAAGTDLNEPGNTLGNLCAGLYFVQVTNALGCISMDTAVVHAPAPINANLGTTPASCHGSCDGTATVAPTGGAGGYTYAWHLGAGPVVTTPQVSGLCAGSYSVDITDANGCTITQGVLVLEPQRITAMAVVGPVVCHDACDGSIHVNAMGGTGTLSYLWAPVPPGGQGTSTATGLCAGSWSVTITDAHACDTTFTLVLTDPPALAVAATHTDNLCYNDCAATAHVDIAGGVLPYTITWLNGAGTVIATGVTDLTGLCRGNYHVVVADAHGCAITTDVAIASGDPMEANLAFLGESCHGPCDGSASVAPTGGSGAGYTILWQPGNPAGQGTGHVTNLCPGNWSVTITDDMGCDTTIAFVIAPFQPIAATATVQQSDCHGNCNGTINLAATGGVGVLGFQWAPEPGTGQGTATIGGLCPGDWTVTITDAAGCDTVITYAITEPPALAIVVDAVQDASCNNASDGAISISITGGTPGYGVAWSGPGGYHSTSEDISGLAPGTYVVVVTDAHLCQTTTAVTVAALSTVVAHAGPDRVECSGVAIALDGSASQGAATYQWADGQGHAIGNAPTIQLGTLPDGVHTFTLTVVNGPCSDTDTLSITVMPLPIADAGEDRGIYIQGTTVLGGSPAGPPGSTFIWQPDSLLDHGNVANPTANVHATTWFFLTVIGPNGCISLDSVLVTVVPQVKVPSGFTPNGDGHNDTWILDFASIFPDIEVLVFSRWGEPLFRSVGYHTPWDGKYDGKPVPMGTYYYVVDLHDDRFPEAITGPLTIIR